MVASLLAWGGLFRAVGEGVGLWSVSKVESSMREPCLPRFILLVIFSDTLLLPFEAAFAVLTGSKLLFLCIWQVLTFE